MCRPAANPTKILPVRVTDLERAEVGRLARAVGETPHRAAHRALVLGLAMQDVTAMAPGGHCLLPGSEGGLLVFSLGPGDAERAAKLITLWGGQ